MDRSNFPTKVEVRSGDLGNVETQASFHIMKRLIDTGQPGIIQGLEVQQSSLGVTRFDILAGHGYTPRGDYVELESTLEGQAVGTLPVSTSVLIGLMYREIATKAGAAETDGVARSRQTVRSSELLVFTSDQWNALPDSFDQDLAANARDRFLVCAIATLPVTTTNPLILTLPPTFQELKTIDQPTNITGLVLLEVSEDTNNSNPFPFPGTADPAQVIFQPSTKLLAYAAPQDATALSQAAPFSAAGVGVPVNVSAGGSFTLTSANGLDTILVQVASFLLPSTTAGASVTDNLNISALYTQVADRGGARDDFHRHKIGGQVPRDSNIHGNRLSEMSTLVEELLGSLTLGTRYQGLAAGEVPPLIWPANTAVNDTAGLYFQELGEIIGASTAAPGTGPNRIRFYRTANDGVAVLVNAKVRNTGVAATFERLTANGDNPDGDAYALTLSPDGFFVQGQAAASSDSWTSWDRLTLAHEPLSSDFTRIDGQLGLGEFLLDTATRAGLARIITRYSPSEKRTLIWQSFRSGATNSFVRLYRVNGAGSWTTESWELTFNAGFANGALNWTKDQAGAAAWKFESDNTVGAMLVRAAATAGTWTDGFLNWDGPEIKFDYDTGFIKVLKADGTSGGFTIDGATGEYRWSPARTYIKAVSGPSGDTDNPASTQTYAIAGDPTVDRLTRVKIVGGNTVFTWNLELPAGAVVTGATLYLDHYDVAGDWIRYAIIRQAKLPTAAESLYSSAYINLVGANPANSSTPFPVDQNATIDPTNYTYMFWIGMGPNALIGVYGVDITYTLDKVRPS